MIRIGFEEETVRKMVAIRKRDRKLFEEIMKKLDLFSNNPQHTSLRNHKLKDSMKEVWSISITDNFRMLYYVNEGKCIFYDLGTHDEVYKK